MDAERQGVEMTTYEEQMVRQVVDGNLDKVDVLDQMVQSGTIQTRDDYDKMARNIAYRVVMRSEWDAAAEEK